MVVVWWVAGAAIFSTVEGAAESETVNRMATLRTDLVLGLATELRQVSQSLPSASVFYGSQKFIPLTSNCIFMSESPVVRTTTQDSLPSTQCSLIVRTTEN